MKNKYNQPRVTSSKKACKCTETGNDIRKFETILFDPSNNNVFCKSSNEFIKFTEKTLENVGE